MLRSAVYAARKQYKEGIALMRKAQGLAPNDNDVLTALGSQLVLSGDVSEGVPILQQVVQKEPLRYDAQLLLGRYDHDTGKWLDSITALESVGGDATLRGVLGGFGPAHIGGDLTLDSSFAPGQEYRATVGGDAAVYVPEDAGLTLNATVDGDVSGVPSVTRHGVVSATWGEGSLPPADMVAATRAMVSGVATTWAWP